MTQTLRIAAIRSIEDHQKAIEALAAMLRMVPDEMLDREMQSVYIASADMWSGNRPYVWPSLTPLDEDRSLPVELFNAQSHLWNETKAEKYRSTSAGRITETFCLSSVFGVLFPTIHRTLGKADCRKARVTQEIEVCGNLDESKYVSVEFVD